MASLLIESGRYAGRQISTLPRPYLKQILKERDEWPQEVLNEAAMILRLAPPLKRNEEDGSEPIVIGRTPKRPKLMHIPTPRKPLPPHLKWWYEDYLKSQEWREKRREAIQYYGPQCQRCGYPHHLEVHHITYENVSNEKMEDLRVVCHSCHSVIHGFHRRSDTVKPPR